MSDKHHPGDWLWVIADGRMVPMTLEAFAEAHALAFGQAPDALDELRAKGHAIGDFLKLALDVLERSGKVRVELRELVTADGRQFPVYARVPPEERELPPQQQRPKRARRKRAGGSAPPVLVLVQGGE